MADAYKVLYQGQLSASVAALYTVPGSKQAIIRHITAVNNDTANRTAALYRNGSGVGNLITPPAMVILPGGMQEFDGAMAMATGDTIQGAGSVASMITVTIEGDEIS